MELDGVTLLPSDGKSDRSKLGCDVSDRLVKPNDDAKFDIGAGVLLLTELKHC